MSAVKILSFSIIVLIAMFITQQWMTIHVKPDTMPLSVSSVPQPIRNGYSPYRAVVFQTTTLDVFQDLKSGHKISITVRQIYPSNKHLLPPFRRINFEFFSLSQSLFFQNALFSRTEFQRMMHRVDSFAASDDVNIVLSDEPILKEIVQEFNDRNAMDLAINKIYIVTQDKGTGIHIDEVDALRLWIPITNSFIDNLCLGVGDVTNLPLSSGYPLDSIIWYQQMNMTSEDWVFFRGHRIPHYSANMGDNLTTQRRSALVVHLKSIFEKVE